MIDFKNGSNSSPSLKPCPLPCNFVGHSILTLGEAMCFALANMRKCDTNGVLKNGCAIDLALSHSDT